MAVMVSYTDAGSLPEAVYSMGVTMLHSFVFLTTTPWRPASASQDYQV